LGLHIQICINGVLHEDKRRARGNYEKSTSFFSGNNVHQYQKYGVFSLPPKMSIRWIMGMETTNKRAWSYVTNTEQKFEERMDTNEQIMCHFKKTTNVTIANGIRNF